MLIVLPDWLIRRVLAFVLGFCLMGMYMAAKEVLAGRFVMPPMF